MKNNILWDVDKPYYYFPKEIKTIYGNNYFSLRKNYSNWIGEITKSFKGNIYWFTSVPASRNPYFSNLFKFICICETLKKISKKKKIFIHTSSINLKKTIKTNFKNKNIIIKKNFFFNFNFWVFIKHILFHILIYCFINFFIKKKKIKKKILIHTSPGDDLSKYERLFPFSKKILNKRENFFFFVPTFITTRRINYIFRLILKMSKSNYIFKEHYYTFKDLINSLLIPTKINFFKTGFKKFRNFDYSNIVFQEIRDPKNYYSIMYGLLNFKFVENLKKEKITLNKIIYWYENQEQKGLNYGFKKYFPELKIYGYQGFPSLPPLMNTIPTKYEDELNLIPDNIIVTSKVYKKNIQEFYKEKNIILGPSLLFSKGFEKIKLKKNIEILVVLNEFKLSNENILEWVSDIAKKIKIPFYIKKPKFLKIDEIIKNYQSNKNLIFTENNLSKLCQESKFVIISGLGLSGTPLEALANGCKLLVPITEPLDKKYFEFLQIKKNFYKLFDSKESLIKYLKLNLSSKKNIISKNEIKKIRLKYFFLNKENVFF